MIEAIKNKDVRYAGFKVRLFAHFIDMCMVLAIMTLLFPSMFTARMPSTEDQMIIQQATEDVQAGLITKEEFRVIVTERMFSRENITKSFTSSIIDMIVAGTIIIVFWQYRSATPGKMILGIKIVDAETNEKPSIGQLIGRYFAYIPAIIPFFLGFLWIIFDKKKQGWHDKMSNTAVIYSKPLDPNAKEKIFKIQSIIALIMLVVFFIFFRKGL